MTEGRVLFLILLLTLLSKACVSVEPVSENQTLGDEDRVDLPFGIELPFGLGNEPEEPREEPTEIGESEGSEDNGEDSLEQLQNTTQDTAQNDTENSQNNDSTWRCSYSKGWVLRDGLTFQYSIDEYRSRDMAKHLLFSANITYIGRGWLGFGFSNNTDGSMMDSLLIVGVPLENGNGFVGEYSAASLAQSDVTLVLESKQTLLNASIYQDEAFTTMTFSKELQENDNFEVNPGVANTLLYAYGSSNVLGMHLASGSFALQILPCNPDAEIYDLKHKTWYDATNITTSLESDMGRRPNVAAHALLSALAWSVFAPLAIGSSVLWEMFSPHSNLWFEIHRGLNVGVAMLVVFSLIFALAGKMRGIDGQEIDHRVSKSRSHRRMGYAIIALVLLQIVVGIVATNFSRDEEDECNESSGDDDEEGNSRDSKEQRRAKSRKTLAFFNVEKLEPQQVLHSTVRIFHRLTGYLILVLSWRECHSGLTLYEHQFHKDFKKLFWGVTWFVSLSLFLLWLLQMLYRCLKWYSKVRYW